MTELVPTVRELQARGLAKPTDWRKGERKNDPPEPTRWWVSDEGHALMGAAMRENALEAIERGEGDWVQPPGRDDLGGMKHE